MSDESAAIVPVAEAFEALGIPYYVGGSVASSAHGVSRSTLDIDLVAALRLEHVDPLVQRFETDFYVEADMLKRAIREGSSFNLVHFPTMMKVDVFVASQREPDRHAWDRLVSEPLYEDIARRFPIASAEDVILKKLEWFLAGGEVSERQWLDVLGVLKVRGEALDDAYLARWADHMGVGALLERARTEARR